MGPQRRSRRGLPHGQPARPAAFQSRRRLDAADFMAFLLHPWVAKATVTKRAGAQGECRHCLSPARLHGGGCQRFRGRSVARRWRRRLASRRGLFAEAEGVLPLPGRHRSSADSARGTSLGRCAGRRWRSDCRGAACPSGNNSSCIAFRRQQQAFAPGDRGPAYELYTRAGTRIVWGTAAGSTALGEPTAEEKVARLVQYAAAHGSLDAAPSLDVRRIPPAGAAKP